jgi:hypothetical protein
MYSIMMEKLAQAGEGGGGVLAHPLSLYLSSRTKLGDVINCPVSQSGRQFECKFRKILFAPIVSMELIFMCISAPLFFRKHVAGTLPA